ncbi:MAG: histidine phosphatase family protein [Candidatus Dactylopiibacterium sp.]|nr:histidine phosphatase family protein [Candidatus Dactylopiibacterium sp.]
MSAVTKICLVRHGETAWNAERRLQGHEDIPLNALGERQAQAAALALRHTRFDAIYSSDLVRAMRTAQTIAAPHALPVHSDARLRERHFGALQGLTRDEADARLPGEYARFRCLEPDACPPGGGEALARFAQRVHGALDALATRHAGQQILLVSHGGCLDVIYRLVTGKPLETARDFPLGNATLNWIEQRHAIWRLVEWDARQHLDRSADELPI